MLQRMLGSGWGVLLPGLLIAGLMYADLSPDQWRIVILMISIDACDAVSQTVAALHFATIVPGVAGIMLMIVNLNQDDKTGRNKKGSKDNWCEGDLNPTSVRH